MSGILYFSHIGSFWLWYRHCLVIASSAKSVAFRMPKRLWPANHRGGSLVDRTHFSVSCRMCWTRRIFLAKQNWQKENSDCFVISDVDWIHFAYICQRNWQCSCFVDCQIFGWWVFTIFWPRVCCSAVLEVNKLLLVFCHFLSIFFFR